MKLIRAISNPGKLLRSLKPRSVSRSDGPSSSSSDSDSHTGYKNTGGQTTPTSVLPAVSDEISSEELSGISADVYSQLVQAFKLIDSDNDGKISKEELAALLCRVAAEPPSEEELRMMLTDVDRDGDGCISLEDFCALSSAFAPPACDSELRVAFDFFDADHDGKITAEELLSVFRTIGDEGCTMEDCRRMITGVDKNGEGFVCFEDFSRMMEPQR